MKGSGESMRRWLAAERAGDPEAAERALRRVFAVLADPLAPAELVPTVLRQIERRPVPLVVAAPQRWAIGISMVLAALSVTLLPWIGALLAQILSLGRLVEFTGVALVAASRALAYWLELWQSIAEVERTLSGLLSRPVVALGLVVAAGLSAIALRILSTLVASKRSGEYA